MTSANDAVWVSVLPAMNLFGPALQKGVVTEADKAGKTAGSRMGGAMKTALAAGGAAIGAVLVKGIADNINIGAANDKLAAQLGLSAKESGRVGKVAGSLYRDAYGDSIEGVNDAVGAVMSGIEGMANASSKRLEGVTAKALDFATAFEVDVTRATQIAGQMMNTGLAKNATEAFDLITAASQRVPASLREDVLDATDEYGQFFSTLGYDGEQAMAMLVEGSKKGMYGIDKLGDAVKEFTIRSTDMSTSSKDAYKTIGLDANDMANKILAGGGTAQKGTQQVIDGLLKIGDPAKQAEAAIALFGTPLEDLNASEIPAFLKSMQGGSDAMDGFKGSAKDMGDMLNKNFKTRMTAWTRTAMGFVQDGLMMLSDWGIKAFEWAKENKTIGRMRDLLGGFLDNVLKPLGRWMMDNKATVATFVSVIGGFLIIRAITAAVMAFNVALAANPIGLVVIAIAALAAGLVYAYKKSDTFRAIVDKAWSAVKKAVSSAWNGFIKPALAAFGDYLTGTLMPTIKRLWNEVVKPTFQAIGQGIKFAWNNVVKPIFKAYWAYLTNVLFPVIKFLWNNVVKPVFKAVGDGIRFAWNNVIKPVFSGLKNYFQNVLFPVIRFLWDKVVKPVFSGLGRTIKGVWNNVVKPTFDALKRGVGTVKDAFQTAIGAVKRIWDGLKRAVMAPVKFVIDTVINKGLIGGFNYIAGKVGADTINPIRFGVGEATGPSPYSGDNRGRAQGGVIPGYSPGYDNHHFYSPTGGRLHLSGGEAIMRPEFTRAMGGERGIAELNKRARRGEHFGTFAEGGVWHPGTRSQRAGHGKSLDEAWDINSAGGTGTPVRAFLDGVISTVADTGDDSYGKYIKMNHPAAGLQSLYAHLSAQLVRVGQSVARGAVIGREGSTGGSTGPHLHFELGGGASAISAAGVGTTGGGAAAPALPGWAQRILDNAIGWVEDRVQGPLAALQNQFPNNPIAGLAAAMPSKVISSMADWAQAKIAEKFAGSTASGASGASVAGISGPVVSQVQQVAAQYGWGAGAQWNALKDLVQRESSWNPRAENPTTTASGLFQFVDGTAQAYGLPGHASSFPVAQQAAAGMRYIQSRYGTPSGAIGFHNANGWYKDGGVLPTYDQGGWLKPGQAGINKSGKPEPVFTNAQWATLSAAVRPTLLGAPPRESRPSTVGQVIEGRVDLDPRTGETFLRAIVKDEFRTNAQHVRTQGGR